MQSDRNFTSRFHSRTIKSENKKVPYLFRLHSPSRIYEEIGVILKAQERTRQKKKKKKKEKKKRKRDQEHMNIDRKLDYSPFYVPQNSVIFYTFFVVLSLSVYCIRALNRELAGNAASLKGPLARRRAKEKERASKSKHIALAEKQRTRTSRAWRKGKKEEGQVAKEGNGPKPHRRRACGNRKSP